MTHEANLNQVDPASTFAIHGTWEWLMEGHQVEVVSFLA